jgi:hypothetical protein
LILITLLSYSQLYVNEAGTNSGLCGTKETPCKNITYAMGEQGGIDIIILDIVRLAGNLNKFGTIRSENDLVTALLNITSSGYFGVGPYTFENIQFILVNSNVDIFSNSESNGYILNNCVWSAVVRKNATIFNLNGGIHSLTNCTFSDIINSVSLCKGGIFFLDGSGSITLNKCIFTSCGTINTNSFGGVIFCSSGVNATIISCNFTGCKVVSGGGVLATDEGCGNTDSKINVRGCIFENCNANGSSSRGGAIFCCLYDKRTLLINETCVFKNCTANLTSGYGGGICLKLCETSNNVEHIIYRLEGSITFDDNCNARNGDHIFIEYSNENDYNRATDINSYKYSFSETTKTICMMNTSDPDSLESVILFLVDKPIAKCEDVLKLTECTSVGSSECIWIQGETQGHKCKEIRMRCEDIDSEKTCRVPGAAKSGSATYDCLWLLGNSSLESHKTDSCVEKVRMKRIVEWTDY